MDKLVFMGSGGRFSSDASISRREGKRSEIRLALKSGHPLEIVSRMSSGLKVTLQLYENNSSISSPW